MSQNKTGLLFGGWNTEIKYAESLGSIYSRNSDQLNSLWRDMPENLRNDPNIRSTVALCFLRLSDPQSAKSVDSDSFNVDEKNLLNQSMTHLFARALLWLYIKNLKVLYIPLAAILNLLFSKYSDSQLVLNMYLKVWSSNTAGLKFILPLFSRAILLKPGADRSRAICYFGYIAGLNCILDDGIRLMETEISNFEKIDRNHPHEFWLQEMYLLLSMLYFYNTAYTEAQDIHAKIAARSADSNSFLFVRTMNYGSWLRLAAILNNHEAFEAISRALQDILQDDYDKRFALRTHSYRALTAGRRQDRNMCLHSLALATSIAEKNPWGLEFCNHLGVTTKIYLFNDMPDLALETACRYIDALNQGSSQSSFVWEANILALKVIIINRIALPQLLVRSSFLNDLERKIHRNLKPFLGLSEAWSSLYYDLAKLANDVKRSDAEFISAEITRLKATHQYQIDDITSAITATKQSHVRNMDSVQFEQISFQTTQALRFNQELLTYSSALKTAVESSLDSRYIAEISQSIFALILPGSRHETSTDAASSPRSIELAPGIVENSIDGHFQLTIEIDNGRTGADSILVLRGYKDSLNFRRDLLAAMILWKDSTESAIRERQMRLRELEHEKARAIAQMTQMLAHDVRKPFSILEMGMELISRAKDPEDLKKSLATLKQEMGKAMTSVNGLITDVMEVGSTATELIQEPVSPESLIESTLGEIFRIYPKADISIAYDLGHTHMTNVHAQKVGRVFSNIVGNSVQAIKYKGQIWFKTKEENGFIEFCLGNSGSFIPAESLPKLFDAFFTSGKQGGTGLGLAIAQKVVTAHGGRIWCESVKNAEYPLGKVEFFFTLPVASGALNKTTATLPAHSREIIKALATIMTPNNSNSDQITDKNESALETEIVSMAQSLGRPISVLIVDDESIYRSALASYLGRQDDLRSSVRVMEAKNSYEAIELSRSRPFDIIITDVDMGIDSLSGFELVGELRRSDIKSLICVHSNRIVTEDHKTAIGAGADAFLPKPMARAQLLRMVLQGALRSQNMVSIQPAAVANAIPEVLIVDDSIIILDAWEMALGSDVKTHLVAGYEELEELVASDPKLIARLSCAVTDMNLESYQYNGLDVGRFLKGQRSELKILLSSDGIISKDDLVGVIDEVIPKRPVKLSQLMRS
jgi:signal transduction histidine kinase/ActR/RegA family two-component response regulator